MAHATSFGHRLEDLAEGVTVFRGGVGKPMPLTSTMIGIEITAGLASVVTTRRFSNTEDGPIEAILTMPVGFNAVVTGLCARIDGRTLRAVVKAKAAARDDYEAAIDAGKLAVLHEEALRGIHVLSVGQLAPGKEVEVELRMMVPLVLSDGGPFLRLPMTAGQLYGCSPLQPADDLITDAQVRHDATLTVRADVGIPHVAGQGLAAPDTPITVILDRAIEITVAGGRFGALTGVSADGYHVRVDLRPQPTADRQLKTAILVDRSGSTSSAVGTGMETVLSAMRGGLAQALADLGDEDHIALWQFNDACQRLGTGRGTEVLGILRRLNRPDGGTSLGAAIRKVAASGIRDILVLTDGRTWDTLLDLPAQQDIRISAVLVGKASLDANIGHLCALTGGDLFYVPDADVGPSVQLALNSMRSSTALRDIELTDGRPSRAARTCGGVEIVASWSDSMDLGGGTDVGRFAAWLCLGQMDEAGAKALALKEGLCTQATSLMLVDDAGEASEGIAETRKVPLMREPALGLREHSSGMARAMFREAEVSDPLPSLRPERSKKPSVVLGDEDAATRRVASKRITPPGWHKIRPIAEGIDWDKQVNRFLVGDLSGLLHEEAVLVAALAKHPLVANVLKTTSLRPELVILLWFAQQYVSHSRAAQRFAHKVRTQSAGRDLAAEIEDQIRMWQQGA